MEFSELRTKVLDLHKRAAINCPVYQPTHATHAACSWLDQLGSTPLARHCRAAGHIWAQRSMTQRRRHQNRAAGASERSATWLIRPHMFRGLDDVQQHAHYATLTTIKRCDGERPCAQCRGAGKGFACIEQGAGIDEHHGAKLSEEIRKTFPLADR